VKITDNRNQTRATRAIRPTKPPIAPPTMGAMLVEELLLGWAVWMDEPAGVEVTTTVWTTTEPLDWVEVDSVVTTVGEVGADTAVGVYGSVVGVLGSVVEQDVL